MAVRKLTPLYSLRHSATVAADRAVTTSTSATESAVDVFAIFIVYSLAIGDDWSQLANKVYMCAGRLDVSERGFISASVRISLVCDADGNRLLNRHHQRDDVLSIMSVYSFVGEFPGRSDAWRLRFGFRLSHHDFKNRRGNNARLIAVCGWLTRRFH